MNPCSSLGQSNASDVAVRLLLILSSYLFQVFYYYDHELVRSLV